MGVQVNAYIDAMSAIRPTYSHVYGDAEQITVYNSLGNTAQDLFAARHVYDKALAENVGVVVEL